MATNPLISQGVLNKIRASMTVQGNASLNVTAGYLGKKQISITLDTPVTEPYPTQVGLVQSPQPQCEVTITAYLLRTQTLSAAYKAIIEKNSVIGNVIVRPDSTALPDFHFYNMAIASIKDLDFAGGDPEFVVTMKGYYPINSDMFSV